jgi:broad specificity phosphatase PhoE
MGNPSIRRIRRATLTVITAALLFFVSAMPAWAMTLTFVRHAESQANADGVIDTSVPGPGLTPLGEQQADDVAGALAANGYDNIYVSSMIRTQQTAEPLADILGLTPVILPGLREISAGIFEGSSEDEGIGRLGYALAPVAWTLGARFVQVPGAENGNAFDARVDDAVRTIYMSGDENAVAFSHGATIMFWVMMNVENPDLGLLLSHQLDNTEAVVLEGSPDEGWTLVSWAGIPVAAEPSLPIKLFVDIRNLVVAPQTALYEVGQAFATGDIGALATAVRNGIVDVARTVINFVPDLVDDVVGSVTDSNPVTLDEAPSLSARATVDPINEDADVDTSEAVTTHKATDSNGATDLTDGNKVEPGEPPADTDEPSGDETEVVGEPTEDADEATDESGDIAVEADQAADDSDTETDAAATEHDADQDAA